MDTWYEEDEEAVGHVRAPHHAIDDRETYREVRVSLEGTRNDETRRARALFEAALRTRCYIPMEDVAADLLLPSETRTTCAYKGHASYFSARLPGVRVEPDIAWTYREPLEDARRVRDLVAF